MCECDSTDGPVSEAAFERRLGELIRAARTNEIDVRGWYPVQGVDEDQDWDVEIVELAVGEDGASV